MIKENKKMDDERGPYVSVSPTGGICQPWQAEWAMRGTRARLRVRLLARIWSCKPPSHPPGHFHTGQHRPGH